MRRILAALALLWLSTGCAFLQERRLVRELRAYDLDVRRTERGVVVYLPDVLFDFDSAVLTAPARTKITAVGSVVQRVTPDRTIAIEGHTDSIGDATYNLGLSERRAQSVEDDVLRGGVSSERARTAGFGETYPIAPNRTADGTDDPDGRRQNRRVEIVIERPGAAAKAPVPLAPAASESPGASAPTTQPPP